MKKTLTYCVRHKWYSRYAGQWLRSEIQWLDKRVIPVGAPVSNRPCSIDDLGVLGGATNCSKWLESVYFRRVRYGTRRGCTFEPKHSEPAGLLNHCKTSTIATPTRWQLHPLQLQPSQLQPSHLQPLKNQPLRNSIATQTL